MFLITHGFPSNCSTPRGACGRCTWEHITALVSREKELPPLVLLDKRLDQSSLQTPDNLLQELSWKSHREETSLSAERKGCAFLVWVVQGERRVLPRVLQVLRTSRVPCLALYAEENSAPPSPSFPSSRQKFPAQPTPCNAPAPSITLFNGCKKAIHPLSRWRRQGKYQV